MAGGVFAHQETALDFLRTKNVTAVPMAANTTAVAAIFMGFLVFIFFPFFEC